MSRRHRFRALPPRHERGDATTLDRIYRDARGRRPDFTRLDRRRPGRHRGLIAGVLVTLAVLAAAAWASFLIFNPSARTSGGDVALTIAAPPAAAIGEEVSVAVTVTNDDHVPLATLALEVHVPDGFALADADPAPDDARGRLRWTLGALDGRGRASVRIRGHLTGAPEQTARFTASAVYRPGNFNADFEARADAMTVLGASPLTLALEGPERAGPGEEVVYVMRTEHVGALPVSGVHVTLDVPRTFVLRSAEPSRARGDALAWDLGALAPGSRGAFTARGTFTAGASDPAVIRATATMPSSTDERITLATQELRTEVFGSAVVLIATANDQTSGFTARTGDTLRLRIAVRNDGQDALRNVTLRATIEATSVAERSILDFSAMADPANGTAVGEQLAPGLRRGTVAWTPAAIPALAEIPAGEQRTIDIALPIHTAASLPGMPAQGRIIFSAAADIGATGDRAQPFTTTTTPITITVQ